jgi:hypothetical protein
MNNPHPPPHKSLHPQVLTIALADPATVKIWGVYNRGNQRVIINFNTRSGLMVMQQPGGTFISSWRTSPEQLQKIIATGRVGGDGRFDTPMPEPVYTLNDLLPVVRSFALGEVDATEFAYRYMRTFKDTRIGHERVFGVLDQLFVDADEYYDDPEATVEQRTADAELLVARAREALAAVEHIMNAQ